MNFKVLVCGSREGYGRSRLFAALDEWAAELSTPPTIIIHGDAPGVDSLAGWWAREHGIHEVRVPAQWDFYGNAAGPIRNAAMLQLAPDLVVAFPGGNGTADMKRRAKKADIPITELS